MAEPAPKRMTVAEFLDFDDGTDTRYELIDGIATAMNPPSEMTVERTMAEPAPRPMSVAEFLDFDDGTDTRHELVGGAPVAMNPPTERHTRIVSALAGLLYERLRPPCRPYQGGGVSHSLDDTTWRIPDIFVSCAAGDGYSRQPRLVIEVLSPSTEKEDRSVKLDFYKSFASVQAILLVWQDTRRVELHERAGDGWYVQDQIGSGAIRLKDLAVELEIDGIYDS